MIDPIALELFKNAIFSIADEMALTVFRTTYSGVLKDNMDYSTGFADADGKLAAQGLTLPAHLGSVPTAMEAIMRHFRDDLADGDVFIMNDPFDGGMHLPDIFIFKPLFHAGERLAFACTVCHHTDVGGRVAGSNASDSTEIYAEGLRIPPLKFYEAGKRNETLVTFIEKNVERKPFVYVDFTCGAWGARPWADGLDGNSHMFANMASHSIEVTEAEHPIQVTAYEFVPDKAGAGKFRGGVPFRRDYRFLEEEGMLQVRSDRRDHRPFGLYGGSPGGPSENYLNPDTENRLLPSKLTMTIKRGDVFRHVLAGAGGWGDPLERDSASVLRDVRNELLSPEKALADYGVVIDLDWRVDEAATARRRGEIAKARGWAAVPKVQRHDPMPVTPPAE